MPGRYKAKVSSNLMWKGWKCPDNTGRRETLRKTEDCSDVGGIKHKGIKN